MIVVDSLDINEVRDDKAYTYLLLGKRNTGKTTLLVDLLFARQSVYDIGIAFTGSRASKVSLKSIIPDTLIYDEWDAKVLEGFFLRVRVMQARAAREGHPPLRVFVILDDNGCNEKVFYDKTLLEIMQNGRHDYVDLFICLQYAKVLRPNMRSQIDFLFAFKEKAPEVRKKLYDCFAGGHFKGERKTFDAVYDKCTEDFRSMVVRNVDVDESDGDFEGGIYYYKAKETHRPFTICSNAVWRQHFYHYNENYEIEAEEEMLRRHRAKREGLKNIAVVCRKADAKPIRKRKQIAQPRAPPRRRPSKS